MKPEVVLSVSEFVAACNQTLEYAYSGVTITGELANFKVSKGKWVYFDLKDKEGTALRFFGSVYQLPGPLEDGMMLAVKGTPRLHPLYNFSVTIQQIRLAGQGTIKKAAAMLKAKLAAEGLFDAARKRPLPYPPAHIGLITSAGSAAYHDFVKITKSRWSNTQITLIDVQVQGDPAPAQIEAAIQQFNQLPEPPDVLAIIRGGGSAEDLQAFSVEQVARAVAASRIPALVAVGHEVDVSLAELVADKRASTPSNAAELLVPDKKALRSQLAKYRQYLLLSAQSIISQGMSKVANQKQHLSLTLEQQINQARTKLRLSRQLLKAYDPALALQRGYAIVRHNSQPIRRAHSLKPGDELATEFSDAFIVSKVVSKEAKL